MSNFSFEGWNSSLPYEGLNSSMSSSSASTPLTFREFSLDEIKKATNNFDQSLLLRKGWIHELYEGTYDEDDGKQRKVIIKVFQSTSPLWHEDVDRWFKDQVQIWSQYRHKHIVFVLGYCLELGEHIVVYEHMVNGSFAQHLSKKRGPASGFYLSWEECLHICIDAARGLEYMHNSILHSDGQKFVHRDVAVTNIMLDENGVAKISDINVDYLSKVIDVPGSLFDPVCYSTGLVKQSSDVYAFGVLLVKVLSRKVSFDKEDRNLDKWFKKNIMSGAIHDQLIHPDVRAEIPPVSLTALVHIIDKCLDSKSEKRPCFSHLVKKLELLMASTSPRSWELFSMSHIHTATNYFQSKILGQGSVGPVYKGVRVTKSKRTVGLKVLKPDFSLGFDRELEMISGLNHPNLVSLVGYCGDSEEKVLVYEFMRKGDLAQNLYRAAKPLSWMQRLKICIRAARGLRYLHSPKSSSREGIIHGDINPFNILLDEDYNAKIYYFGLSKSAPQDQASSEVRTLIKGTDVYAFGLVLSEVLCKKRHGRRGDYSFFPIEDQKYVQWAKENIDPYLKDLIDPICFEVFVGLIEECLNVNPETCPKMNEVVSTLEYALKWQKARGKPKYGGDLCLPPGDDRVIIYRKPYSDDSMVFQLIVRFLSGVVHYEVRDIQHDLCVKELKHALGNTADINVCEVFVNEKHVEDLDEIEKQYGQFLPPSCDNCQQAFDCGNCKMNIWYINCKNCDALTIVKNEWEKPLRSCYECNMNELVCGSFDLLSEDD